MGEPNIFTWPCEFKHYTCARSGCGASLFIPNAQDSRLRLNHESFYCLHGHPQSFTGESELEKTKRLLANANQRLEFEERAKKAAQANLKLERRRTAAQKGQLTKIKNRVGNGVCPCCNRTFGNLQRHMHTKHPDYRDEGAEETVRVDTKGNAQS